MNNLNDAEKGYLLGLFVGDGYLYYDKWRHYKINFFLNSKKDIDISQYTVNLLEKINAKTYMMNHKGCLIIRVNSKNLYYYIKNETNRIDNNKNKEFKIGFISGFIDSDGYVSKGDIIISNVDNNLLNIVKNFCRDLDVETKIWKQKNVFNDKIFKIFRLRISTTFKYEKHYSQKIHRIYGGVATYHSE